MNEELDREIAELAFHLQKAQRCLDRIRAYRGESKYVYERPVSQMNPYYTEDSER